MPCTSVLRWNPTARLTKTIYGISPNLFTVPSLKGATLPCTQGMAGTVGTKQFSKTAKEFKTITLFAGISILTRIKHRPRVCHQKELLLQYIEWKGRCFVHRNLHEQLQRGFRRGERPIAFVQVQRKESDWWFSSKTMSTVCVRRMGNFRRADHADELFWRRKQGWGSYETEDTSESDSSVDQDLEAFSAEVKADPEGEATATTTTPKFKLQDL